MQWLKLMHEDAGTQALKIANVQPRHLKSVHSITAYPSILPEPPKSDHRNRLKTERRKKQIPIILDTRTKKHQRSNIHIDVYA